MKLKILPVLLLPLTACGEGRAPEPPPEILEFALSLAGGDKDLINHVSWPHLVTCRHSPKADCITMDKACYGNGIIRANGIYMRRNHEAGGVVAKYRGGRWMDGAGWDAQGNIFILRVNHDYDVMTVHARSPRGLDFTQCVYNWGKGVANRTIVACFGYEVYDNSTCPTTLEKALAIPSCQQLLKEGDQ